MLNQKHGNTHSWQWSILLVCVMLAACGGTKTLQRPAGTTMTIAEYEAALEKDRSDWRVFVGYAQALRRAHRYDRAIATYEAVLGAFPDMAEPVRQIRKTHKDRAAYYLAENRFGAAQEALRSSLTTYPEDPWFMNRLGAALQSGDRPEAALAQYEKTLAVDPAAPGAANALQQLRASVENARRLTGEAATHFESREYEQSAELSTRALKAAPGFQSARMFQALAAGAISMTRGSVETYWSAIEQFSKAQVVDGQSALVYYHLAKAYEKLGAGQWDNMKRAYQQAGEVEPDSLYAKKAAHDLAALIAEKEKLKKFWGK